MQQNHREQGGVIAYIIVGVVLLGLLAGGVYLAKQQARIARDSGEPGTQAPAETQNGQEERQPPETQQPGEQDEETTPAPAPRDDETETGNGAAPVTPSDGDDDAAMPTTGPNNIAATGPEDFVASLVAVAVIGGASTAYLASHRHLLRAHK